MDRFTATMSNLGAFDPGSLPAGYRYATLGPNSLIDLVNIDGQVLGPDTVVDLSGGQAKLSRVRPLRVTGGQVDGLLELELWLECETPVPRPRNPAVVTYGATVAAAGGYQRLIRLPFAGRRAGVLHLNGDVGKAYDWAVYGVKFLNTGAVAGAARDMYVHLDSATETPANSAVAAVGLLGLTLLVGGIDSHEDFDEIELWAQGDVADAELDVRAEAYDLCR